MAQINRTKQIRMTIFSTIILLALTLFLIPDAAFVTAQSGDRLDVTFIDVGQGDSSLLHTSSGFEVLIDAGPSSAGQTVLSLLNEHSISVLEVIVISHNHADHIGGLLAVLQSGIDVGSVYYNGNSCDSVICQNVWAEMTKRGITPKAVKTGDTFYWGAITGSILNPQASPTGDENEDSVVADVRFGDSSILFTGDIGFSTESALLSQGALDSTVVLKVAHHGSAYSTSDNFLNVIHPVNAVIPVGNNSYGHPSDDTLNRLTSSGATIYRTDLDGNVTFTFYESPPVYTVHLYLPIIMSDN